jgi:hypothetical protein
MRYLVVSGLALALASLSGCALTVNDTRVDYHYTKVPAADFTSSPERIKVGNFEDSRGMENPRMIMHSQNMYGNTMSGGTQAEKPLAEIVRDGVIQGLTTAHAHVADDDPSVVLTGELMEYGYTVVQGFWTGTANTKLMVKLRLTKSGNTVWSDTILGKASYHGGGNPGEDVLFRMTLDDFVERLQKDEDLQRALHAH